MDKKERAFMEELIGSVEGSVKQRGAFVSTKNEALATDTISPFDSLFQLHADSLSMDWRMLAAVAFKESRFDTSALSSAGAEGLMQMMPETAASLGVDAKDGVSPPGRGPPTATLPNSIPSGVRGARRRPAHEVRARLLQQRPRPHQGRPEAGA